LYALLQQLVEWDGALMEAAASVRWEPLTALFVLSSAWWVKWPLFTAVGACTDATRRVRLPCAALAAGTAAALAGIAVAIVKELVGRARPPVADPALEAIGSIPSSTSFPSGHSATAFAAAVALGLLHRRLRAPLLAVAVLVALSRVYLGVHYFTDIVAGSLLGIGVGLAVGALFRRRLPAGPPASPPAAPALPAV
jgi:membrane-associated phospholipid phosphatase